MPGSDSRPDRSQYRVMPRRVWWLRPLVGLLGLVSLVAAVGGLNSPPGVNLSEPVVVSTAVSALAGLILVLWFLLKPFNLPPGLHRGIGYGSGVMFVVTMRGVMSDQPVLGAIVFGLIAGWCIAASVLPSRLHPVMW